MTGAIGIEEWATQMIELMSPVKRRQLIRKILHYSRQANSKRIRQQIGPDGKAWAPRKKRRRGRGKNKLLQGFSKIKHLKIKATRDAGSLTFPGKEANRIASIHHYGLVDQVSRRGPKVEYPARELIGISKDDDKKIDDIIATHFGLS